MPKNTHNQQIAHLLTIALIVTIILAPCFTALISPHPVSASSEDARWTKVNTPAGGDAGGWVLADGSDVLYLTAAADGTLYAYGAGLAYTLLKSTDGGLKWSCTGQVQGAITGIAISPHDMDAVYYTTDSSVYRSRDGGNNFIPLAGNPGGAGMNNVEITSIAVGWLYGNIIAVATRDTDSLQYGGVYTFDEAEVMPAWTDTGIGDYDTYAVAFSPGYSSDRQITTVSTDETDSYVFSKIGNTGWNAIIGPAKLNRDNSAIPAAVAIAKSAVIAFPDNYDAETGPPECSLYIGIDTGAGQGDVYKITCVDAPSASIAADLNIGGRYGTANTDITGLSVHANGEAVIILAGPAANTRIYISTDGGITWARSSKSPTGDSETYVLFSRDFGANGIMYAATGGDGSALSVSGDTGVSWDQISLVDTAIDTIIDMAPSPNYDQDRTLFITTFGAGPYSGGLWRTTDEGLNWERVLSGVHPAVDTLSLIGLPPRYGNDCQTFFVTGESSGSEAIWESDDGGRTFRVRPTCDPVTGAAFPVDAWNIADENTIFIGSYNGTQGLLYRTINGGLFFTEATTAGSNSIYSIALSPDYQNDGIILVGNNNGAVYRSADFGASFTPLPSETASGALSSSIDVAFDPGFKENRTIYACSISADAGFYRFNVSTGDYWESIDSTLQADAVIHHLAVSGGNVLYGVNSDADGGMERCLNPGASGPEFERVALGLSAGATLSGIRQAGNRIWAIDTMNCKLMTYIDNLTSPVVHSSPENSTPGAGSLADHTVKNITLDWETAEGATGYEYQCTVNTDFTVAPAGFQGTVTGSSVSLPPLDPATVYYWRVRVGTPVLSPWSDWWSFSTSLDTEVVALKPESPAAGASDIPVRPVFQWTAVVGASAYELLVATDTGFDNPVIIRTNEFSPKTNAWKCDVGLEYATTYYWKVRAMTASTYSSWSSIGVFTTEPAPLPDEWPGGEQPELSLLERQDSMMALPPPKNKTPEQLMPPAATTATVQANEVSQLPAVPNWIIYFIGGLLAIVMLSLIIVLAAVLKIKRF